MYFSKRIEVSIPKVLLNTFVASSPFAFSTTIDLLLLHSRMTCIRHLSSPFHDPFERTSSSPFFSEHGLHARLSLIERYQTVIILQSKMEELRSRRIHRIVEGFLPKTMDPKDRASEIDLLLQFCLSLSKVRTNKQTFFLYPNDGHRAIVRLKKKKKKKQKEGSSRSNFHSR